MCLVSMCFTSVSVKGGFSIFCLVWADSPFPLAWPRSPSSLSGLGVRMVRHQGLAVLAFTLQERSFAHRGQVAALGVYPVQLTRPQRSPTRDVPVVLNRARFEIPFQFSLFLSFPKGELKKKKKREKKTSESCFTRSVWYVSSRRS